MASRFDTHNHSYKPPHEPLKLKHWVQGAAFGFALLFIQGYLDGREANTAQLQVAQTLAKAVITTEPKEPQ
jgi:hypothetical protein